ncbi:MAG: hypothetical protein LBJ93_03270 [Clostridiales bacterium]|nr:hypothetical protein [Clostridiales bacterium]
MSQSEEIFSDFLRILSLHQDSRHAKDIFGQFIANLNPEQRVDTTATAIARNFITPQDASQLLESITTHRRAIEVISNSHYSYLEFKKHLYDFNADIFGDNIVDLLINIHNSTVNADVFLNFDNIRDFTGMVEYFREIFEETLSGKKLEDLKKLLDLLTEKLRLFEHFESINYNLTRCDIDVSVVLKPYDAAVVIVEFLKRNPLSEDVEIINKQTSCIIRLYELLPKNQIPVEFKNLIDQRAIEIAEQTIRSSRDYYSCIVSVNYPIFKFLELGTQRLLVTQTIPVIENDLRERRLDNLSSCIFFTSSNLFYLYTLELREKFAIQMAENILLEILGNLEAYSNLLQSYIFYILPYLQKERIAIEIIKGISESISDDLDALRTLLRFAGQFVIPQLKLERQIKFYAPLTEIILLRVLGNLQGCNELVRSDLFSKLLPKYQKQYATQMFKSVLETESGDLKACFELDKCNSLLISPTFNFLPFEEKEIVIISIIEINSSRILDDLDTFLRFAKYLLRYSPSERAKMIATRITDIILPEILGNVKACTKLVRHELFKGITLSSVENKEKLAIEMVKKALEAKPYSAEMISEIISFADTVFLDALIFGASTFAVSVTEIIFPIVSDDLTACNLLVSSRFFHSPFVQSRELATRMTEIVRQQVLNDPREFLFFVRSMIILYLTTEQRQIFLDRMNADVLELVLGNLNECIRFANSHFFYWLPQQQQRLYASAMTESIERISREELDNSKDLIRLSKSDIFKFLSYEKKVHIFIQILNHSHYSDSFFDLPLISNPHGLQFSSYLDLEAMEICEKARELALNPPSDTPEIKRSSQMLQQAYNTLLENYRQILMLRLKGEVKYDLPSLIPQTQKPFFQSHPEFFSATNIIKLINLKMIKNEDQSEQSR